MSKILTNSDVLELIEPADPDSLHLNANGSWEALWSPANPHAMDIEIIRRTPEITIVCESHFCERLPRWTAILFRIEQVTG
jgi:hypothetical protein